MNEGNLGELFAALSKFQGVIEPAIKAKTGYGYKYADIESVIKAAQKPLVDNGLCVTHLMRPVEGGGDASFGNGDGLLFHGFVDCHPVVLAHFIELIDAADASIGEYDGSGLEGLRSCAWISDHGGGETGGGDCSTAHVNRPRGEIRDSFEHLTLP